MKHITLFIFLAAILLASCGTRPDTKVNDSEEYTIYLVRHCKKADDGTKDPPLTKEGEQSADRLASLLSDKGIQTIYTSDYLRTKGTGQPLASTLGLDMKIYNPRELAILVEELKIKKSTVLVVGHSNSTPSLANLILGQADYEQFDESQYDQIIQISFKGDRPSHSISDF